MLVRGAGRAGAGPSQARGRRARRRRDLRRRARPERRHLQEARPRARHFLHPGRRRDDPGRHLQRRADRRRDRLPRHHRRLRQGRAGARHRLDLHRRQPVVLVRARRLPDQVAEGCRRQDRGLFDQRLLDPHLGAGAEEIHRRRFQADADRRRARHLHPGDERPDRRRLGRRAVRRRCGRAGQDPRRRQGLGRSGAGPPDHPAPDRQLQRDGAAAGRVRALHARLPRGARLGLFDAGGSRAPTPNGPASRRRPPSARLPNSCRRRRSIPTGFPASTTSWPMP